jgi:hypothetical protein
MSELETKNEDVHTEIIQDKPEVAENIQHEAIEKTPEELESAITELIPAKSKTQEFIEFFRDLIIILIVVMFIRTYLVAPFQIS